MTNGIVESVGKEAKRGKGREEERRREGRREEKKGEEETRGRRGSI